MQNKYYYHKRGYSLIFDFVKFLKAKWDITIVHNRFMAVMRYNALTTLMISLFFKKTFVCMSWDVFRVAVCNILTSLIQFTHNNIMQDKIKMSTDIDTLVRL